MQFSYEDSRGSLQSTAQSLIEEETPANDVLALKYLIETKNRLPNTQHQFIDPKLAHEASTIQRLLGQTSYRIYTSTNDPSNLDTAILAYQESVRTCGRSPNPELLVEAIKIYRSHGAHEGALRLCAMLIQDHPNYSQIGHVVMNAISCMIELKVQIPGAYVSWLCQMPGIEETDALLLTAKAQERRNKREEARAGYREIFLRLKTREIRQKETINSARSSARSNENTMEYQGETKNSTSNSPTEMEETLIGKHTSWETWCEDPDTWIKAGRPWYNKQEYELSNIMFQSALSKSSFPGDECLCKMVIGYTKIGNPEKATTYFKRMNKGKFRTKVIGTHRTYPKWSKVSMRPGSDEYQYTQMIENSCFHIAKQMKEDAFKLDDRERQKENTRGLKKSENETRLFLTEEKIWNACVTIGCSMRMWIAQALLRRRRRAVLKAQSMLRVYIAKLKVNRIRALLHLRGIADNVMVMYKLQVSKIKKRRSEHREWSTVVSILFTLLSFKPVSLSLSRSPLF